MDKPSSLTLPEWNALLGFYSALDQHRLNLLDDVLTGDWADLPPAPGQQPGPEGIKPILQGLLTAFPDLTARVEDVIAENGRAAARVTLRGTHRGALFGIRPTGKQVSFSLHEFHRFHDGRICETRHMEEWLGLFIQLGSFPTIPIAV